MTTIHSRRAFLTSALAASAATISRTELRAAAPAAREYYDLRAYRLKPGGPTARLEAYFEKALLPALERRGIKPVGVFTELEVNKTDQTSVAKPDTPMWVLIPHATLDSFVSVSAEINTDPAVQKAGADYLQSPKANPAYDRIDSWLLRAFKGHPVMTLPEFSKKRVPTRVFEMRDYESHSELKALAKMNMFDEGEEEIMRDLGMSPVFFGQALAGPNLPHLRYITAGPDLASHLNAWNKFGPDPRWVKMRDLPQYADATSKNTARFLAPRPYSGI
jgi:NIPSNAP protein